MVFEEIALFKDVGIGIASIVILIGFSRFIVIKSLDQVKEANQSLRDNQAQFQKFMEDTFKKNTEALINMTSCLETHTKTKDQAMEILQSKDKTINELFEMLKKEISTSR